MITFQFIPLRLYACACWLMQFMRQQWTLLSCNFLANVKMCFLFSLCHGVSSGAWYIYRTSALASSAWLIPMQTDRLHRTHLNVISPSVIVLIYPLLPALLLHIACVGLFPFTYLHHQLKSRRALETRRQWLVPMTCALSLFLGACMHVCSPIMQNAVLSYVHFIRFLLGGGCRSRE